MRNGAKEPLVLVGDRLRARAWIIAGVVVAAVVTLAWVREPMLALVPVAIEHVQSGRAGTLTWFGAYLVGLLLMMPASAFEMGSGFLCGLLQGFLVAHVGSVGFGTLSFLIARVFRGRLIRLFQDSAQFRAIDRAIERRALSLVILLRLSPVLPFSVLSYALGLTRVRLVTFVLGTWAGSLPSMLLFVYVGSTLGEAAQLLDGSGTTSGGWGAQIAGLVLTLAGTWAVTRVAREALAHRVEP